MDIYTNHDDVFTSKSKHKVCNSWVDRICLQLCRFWYWSRRSRRSKNRDFTSSAWNKMLPTPFRTDRTINCNMFQNINHHQKIGAHAYAFASVVVIGAKWMNYNVWECVSRLDWLSDLTWDCRSTYLSVRRELQSRAQDESKNSILCMLVKSDNRNKSTPQLIMSTQEKCICRRMKPGQPFMEILGNQHIITWTQHRWNICRKKFCVRGDHGLLVNQQIKEATKSWRRQVLR